MNTKFDLDVYTCNNHSARILKKQASRDLQKQKITKQGNTDLRNTSVIGNKSVSNTKIIDKTPIMIVKKA